MLRVLAICLLISNIALGALGYVIIREVDRNYSTLLQSSLPVLNTVKALSWHAVRVQRVVNRAPGAQGSRRGELLAQQARDMDDAAHLLHQIGTGVGVTVNAATLNELTRGQKAYFDTVLEWRRLITAGQDGEAADYLALTIRPAYDGYATTLEDVATDIHDYGLSSSASLSSDARRLGNDLVIASAWPLWLGGIVIAGVLLCAVALGMLIRWKAPNLLDS